MFVELRFHKRMTKGSQRTDVRSKRNDSLSCASCVCLCFDPILFCQIDQQDCLIWVNVIRCEDAKYPIKRWQTSRLFCSWFLLFITRLCDDDLQVLLLCLSLSCNWISLGKGRLSQKDFIDKGIPVKQSKRGNTRSEMKTSSGDDVSDDKHISWHA